MLKVAFLGCAFIFPSFFATAFAGQLDLRAENTIAENAQIPLGHRDDHRLVCHGISRSISSASQVFYPGTVSALFSKPLPITYYRTPDSPQFAEDIAHWANSSSQISACSVRPGTVEDLGLIVRDGSSHLLV